jgi:hypothetical protein
MSGTHHPLIGDQRTATLQTESFRICTQCGTTDNTQRLPNPFVSSTTCHGHEYGSATHPPTMRVAHGFGLIAG